MTRDRSSTPESAKTAVDRLTFFSDAVVAIALTLLAIELPVPHSASRHELFEFVGEHVGEYLAFLVSFVVISASWRGHHRLYRYVTDVCAPLVTTNTAWLLMIVLTPFATTLLFAGEDVTDTDFPWRFGFYALVQATGALLMLRQTHIIERERLLQPDAPEGLLLASHARVIAIASTFLVSIPVAFLVGPWAFLVWGLLAATTRLTMRLQQRRHPAVNLRP